MVYISSNISPIIVFYNNSFILFTIYNIIIITIYNIIINEINEINILFILNIIMRCFNSSYNEETILLSDIQNELEYSNMIDQIENIYEKNELFILIIETNNVRNIKFNYLYKFGNYLKRLKTRNPQELQGTIIRVYDDIIYNLLYTLFTFISKPVACVKVIYYEGGYIQTPSFNRKIKKIKEYYP